MLKNNKVLLASSNQGKIKEFKKIFKGFDFISQEDLGIDDAVEDGISFFENALKKARHGSNKSGLFTVANDSGLVVPGLDYEPEFIQQDMQAKEPQIKIIGIKLLIN